MKKLISCATVIAMIFSLTTFVYAEDSFSVKNSTEKLTEDFLSINISTPYFEGFKAADEINRKIDNMVADSVGDARTVAKYMKESYEQMVTKGEEPIKRVITLDTTYDYIKSGDILSLQYNTYYYSGGAHPTNWVNAITANTATGEIYTFKSLFKENSEYASYITNKIIEAIDKNKDYYFKDYTKTINNMNGDYNFYFDGNKLIVYFGLYQIAPYVAGIDRFAFSAEDLKPILKDEVYNSIKDSKPIGAVRYNGNSVQTQQKSYSSPNGIMVPLRAIAETLGYKVDWNEKDGAIVEGGFIKENVNSYWKTGKEPVQLIPPVVTDGVTYVPLQYFKDVLDENVSIGYYKYTYISDTDNRNPSDWVVRTYAKNGYNNVFNKLILQFKSAKSDEECAFLYAEAVLSRNGAVQYALLTDKLKDEQYKNFKDINFVTGVSSPWIDSYGISKVEDGKYKIIFHLKTSTPTPVPDLITNITIVNEAGEPRISVLESINK